VDLAAAASLIVATFELSVVRGVIGAIRTADISSGKGISATPLGPDPNPDIAPRLHVQPAATYEPRVHIHPVPRYEGRAAVRPAEQYEPARESQYNAAACGWMTADAPKPACPNEGPIPPVWKQLPPVRPPDCGRARRMVKVIRQQPDVRHRGTLVDIHI
jgi:hypothetical protein